MIWDDPRKLSSFITPKDTSVTSFARNVIGLFRHARFKFMNKNLQSAIQIFDALEFLGEVTQHIPDKGSI